jgi:60 kDa SS-A/Ro ribonucleoprotein
MSFFARHLSAIQEVQNNTPATMSIPGREQEMARNNNGGFSFVIDAWSFYDRFLIIGPQSGNNAKDANLLADEGIALVKKLIKIDAIRVLSQAVQFSLEGRAPKNDSAIIAIAMVAAYGNSAEQVAAYEAMLDVCRTGTHLFLFVQVVNQFGKWNAAAKRGVAKWYTSKQDDRLAVQLLKYQNRNGWSHRDVLRLGHIKPQSDVQNAMFRHVVGSDKKDLQEFLPELFEDVRIMNSTSDSKVITKIIEGNSKISWEMVPTQFLNDAKVLEALLPNMGMTALIRQLGRFSANGLTTPLSNSFRIIRDKLSSVEAIKNGRLH